MIGITMSDLYDYLKNNHEIEFRFNDIIYTIQPKGSKPNCLWSIWKDRPNGDADCICEYLEESKSSNLDDEVQKFLNVTCFEGKSFMDIEEDVTIEVIF